MESQLWVSAYQAGVPTYPQLDINARSSIMDDTNSMFVYVGIYPSKAAARDDNRLVRELYGVDLLGSYDSAVVTKDDHGRVHVNKDEMAARHGAWGGAVVGAVVGLLFPPALIVYVAAGAGIGELAGHLARGISRSDVKDLGELIDAGEAALVVVAASPLAAALQGATLNADREITRELGTDWDDLDLDALRSEAVAAAI
jgi:uncharacterized membrane protein